MNAGAGNQESEVRRKWTVNSEQWTEGRDSGRGIWGSGRLKFIVHRSSSLVFLLASGFWLLTSAPLCAATHVTATYDLGANPQVMTTVSGQPQYGLVFAERNKSVTYNSVEYSPSAVKGYLNASGQLNNGAGNLWLDLIPNLGATPADSYYVVTFNIQGRVHAEIWLLPDVSTVAADAVRQTQPPSSSNSSLDLSLATGLLTLAHGGTAQASWTANRCVRVNSAGTALESAGADCGTGGGGSAPIASATVSGTVKTDGTVADPVVYLTTTADTLLAGKANTSHTHSEGEVTNLVTDLAAKAPLAHSHVESDVTNLVTDLAAKVPTSRSVSTSSPLAGGGTLAADLTLACPTCEVTGNKDAASGYAGLTSGSKLTASQGQEVWSSADLTDFASKSGSGTTILGATITSPASTHYLGWSGTNWVNRAIAAGDLPSHSHAAGDVTSGTFGFARGGSNQTSWTASRCVRVNDAGTALESASGDCGTGGGGGDNISVNGTAATDADFDDATPAAPANKFNVKWQKDALSPTNISAYFDPTLMGTTTLGANADFTWTFDSAGTTNPSLAWTSAKAKWDFGNVANNQMTVTSSAVATRFAMDNSNATPNTGFALQVGGVTKWSVAAYQADTGNIELTFWNDQPNTSALQIDGDSNKITGTVFNGTTGFQVNGAATTDRCLLGDGTNFIGSSADCLTISNTKTLTNKTLDAEGTGNNLTTVSKVYMLAAGCDNATAAAAWDLPTSSAMGKACLGTGPRFGALTAADAATSGAFTSFRLPSDWTGNVDLVLLYTGDTNSTNNIVWQPAESCVADGEDLLAASFTTTSSATGAGPTTAGQRKSLTFSNMTMTGCAAGETMFLRIQRLGSDGSDAYTGVAQLMAVEMTLRRQQ